MICKDQRLYRQTLLHLQASGVYYCVIGSFGLGLHNRDFLLYPVQDCDLLIRNQADNLNKLAKVLQELHWQLYLWEEPVSYPLPLENLPGKYYLRAKQRQAILDLTYECASILWSACEGQVSFISGIPVASIDHILHLKKVRNREKDRHVIEHVQNLRLKK